MTTTRLALRMTEVAELLGVGSSTVQRWCSDGSLVSVRIGGVVLVQPADLDAFLTSHREGRGVTPLRARRTA